MSLKLVSALKAVNRCLFQENIVITSQPVRLGDTWKIAVGNQFGASVEEFSSAEDAARQSRLYANAASMGAGMVYIKIVVLTTEQVRRGIEQKNFREVIDEQIRQMKPQRPS